MQIVSSELIEFFVEDLDVRLDSLESKISPSNILNSGNIWRISRLKIPVLFFSVILPVFIPVIFQLTNWITNKT